MDLAIFYRDNRFDLGIESGDLATEQGLRSAVIVSLFTDRRAAADDELPAGDGDRRGWWADAWPEIDGDLIGSRLWLLRRSKQIADVPSKAQEYAEEALAWMIDDGIATAIAVEAEQVDTGLLGIRVEITLPNDTRYQDVFNYSLEAA